VTSSQIQSVQGAQVTGSVSGSQISGTIPVASLPAGSSNYLQNTLTQQLANFNISGQGTVGGTLSANAVNATTQYNIGGQRVLSIAGITNLFVGSGSGTANTTGLGNSFFGPSAGLSNTAGGANSFFGYAAGVKNTTGSGNSFFGYAAGFVSTTGNGNSFFGEDAGNKNTTGSLNSFFGEDAGWNNTTGNQNSFFGRGAGINNTTGISNTFVGYTADFSTSNPTGNNNTLLGYNTKVNSGVSNATAIGASAQVTASNTIVLGTSSETVIVRGKLQVDTLGTAGSQQVCLNGSNRLAPCSSSLRYKTDLQPFTAGLAIINRLEPISFTWKTGGGRDVGFGAEAVERVEPLFITYNAEGQVEGVKYDRITVALVNAIKEQQQQIAAQQRQLAELSPLQTENAKLKLQLAGILARLEQLKKLQAGQK
jgi:hypothetical protein